MNDNGFKPILDREVKISAWDLQRWSDAKPP